jgi:hypothetical protein
MVGFAHRQVERLLREVVAQNDNPAFVVIEDGQSISDLTITVTDVAVGPSQSIDGVYRFRISDYAGADARLVSQIESAVADAAWIIIHVGGTMCPPALLELVAYISTQNFQKPRFLVVVERLDLECASSELLDLFTLGRTVDLTTNRDSAYFLELVAPLGASQAATEKLVQLHLLIVNSVVPARLQSLRTLIRACEMASYCDLQRTLDSQYLAGLDPSTADYSAVKQLIEEVCRDGST